MIELLKIPLSQIDLWELNPKRHEIEQIAKSIQRYGFCDPPAFDNTLGGIIEGNGRIQALALLFAQNPHKPPSGIELHSSGEWLVPVIHGLDAPSMAEAEGYAIDHNNLTMVNIDPEDIAEAWEQDEYIEILAGLEDDDALPVTVSAHDLALLIEGSLENEFTGWNTSIQGSSNAERFEVIVNCTDKAHQDSTLDTLIQLGYRSCLTRVRKKDA